MWNTMALAFIGGAASLLFLVRTLTRDYTFSKHGTDPDAHPHGCATLPWATAGFITRYEGCSSLRFHGYHRSHLERWWCSAIGVTANVGDLWLNAMTLASSIGLIQSYSFVHTQTCHHTYGKHGSDPGSHPRGLTMLPQATAVRELSGSGGAACFHSDDLDPAVMDMHSQAQTILAGAPLTSWPPLAVRMVWVRLFCISSGIDGGGHCKAICCARCCTVIHSDSVDFMALSNWQTDTTHHSVKFQFLPPGGQTESICIYYPLMTTI